jgi:hypothetical protein
MNEQHTRHIVGHWDARVAKRVAQRLLRERDDHEEILLALPYRRTAEHRRRPDGLLVFTPDHILDVDLHLDRSASRVLSARVTAERPRHTPISVRTDLPPILRRTKGIWIQIADRDPVFIAADDWWDDPPVVYW